jgi:ATP-dependent helicase/nuclease subunit A
VPWTESQLAAITHPGGDLIVSAAAGSGKTAVLAERCARLVCGGKGCGVENLLVLTFTEAAAAEMKARIAAAIAGKLKEGANRAAGDERWLRRQAAMIDRANISTLHAFCARILRQHFHEAGVDPAFEVMDQDEASLLQEEILQSLIAKWHKLPPGLDPAAGVTAERFEDIFERYAQGSEGACGALVLGLHRMLATTESPERFKERARRAFGEDAAETVEQYSSDALMGRLKEARLVAQRAHDEVSGLLNDDKEDMVVGLREALLQISESIDDLRDLGLKAWPYLATKLKYKWMRLYEVEHVSDFAGLKARTWQEVKDTFQETARLFQQDPQRMVADLKSLAAPLEALLAMGEAFDAAYGEAKRAQNQLDFADLERYALNLLRAPGSLAAVALREQFRHVLVDEFQDINPLQEALLEAVRHPGRFDGRGNLFVVGDVKQSIYGFRLAEPELFITREKAALASDASGTLPRRHVALQENFRSHLRLLEVMNAVFRRVLTPEVVGVDYAHGHELRGGKTDQADALAEVHLAAPDAAADDADEVEESGEAEEEGDTPSAAETEARLVAQRIESLIREGRLIHQKDGPPRKVEYRDIAILLRSARTHGMIFLRALSDRGIPVHADLQNGFFDTPEVRHAVALLQVLDNPRQDIPLATVLLGPFGNFSHDDLALIRLTFDRKEVSFAEAAGKYPRGADETRLRDAPADTVNLTGRLVDFFNRLTRWRNMLLGRPLHEGLAAIFAESGIYAYLAASDAGRQRVANLQMLHQRALAFASFRKQGLHRFLRFIEKLRQQEEADGGEAPILSEASNVVRIMTIHKSKGLEFPVVFVSGLGSLLRLAEGGSVVLHRDLGVGLSVVDLERNIQYPSAATLRIREARRRSSRAEELRLLYVAMTRARDGLILTGHLRKADEIQSWRKTWQGHAGAVPEDVLLKGRRALDWLMPALVLAGGRGGGSGLAVAWPDARGETTAQAGTQVAVYLHRAAESAVASETAPAGDAVRLMEGQPLEVGGAGEEIAALVERVTQRYGFESEAARPAVQTVSFLKTLTDQAAEEGAVLPEALEPLAELSADHAAIDEQIEAARLRGLATHRILELVDFARCDSEARLQEQVAALVEQKQLTAEEARRADWEGIRWFLWHSRAGARVASAARAGGRQLLRRELPFAWVGGGKSDGEGDPAPLPEDLSTIRGVIDVLLVDPASKSGEIIDYKTDSARLWEGRVDDYRRQMRYYMAAAGDILGFPIQTATLVFLAARQEVVVPSAVR